MCVLGGKVVGCWAKMFCNWPSFMTTAATRINPGKFLLGFRAPFVKNTMQPFSLTRTFMIGFNRNTQTCGVKNDPC